MTPPQTPPAPTINTRDITGLILCGGAGQRMGGRDKGLIEFQGKPLVDIAIGRLRPQVHSVMISANRHADAYAMRGLRVIRDDGFDPKQQHFNGPLAGILAGLAAMQTEWLMVVPCDCPGFPLDLVSTLTDALRMPATNPSSAGAYVQGHPVFALLSKSIQPDLEDFLASGERTLGRWLARSGAVSVPARDESAFQNMNSPEDLIEPR
jgi:molybdenum cofactor guanylyltransferase